ncbi:MAG: glutamine-hydrolyzing carbamoyl-phosphate synthase small subunit [Rickettsiales bacterium]|nr:glutamine-hydrolyzing carbamoyl-phosphate synthase small subunit [Rickettsiales bacterium]
MKDTNNFYQLTKNAVLIFPDGNFFYGYGIGKKSITKGEICFNTAITGYQEILTDPSYLGQIITFTFPHIGNVGTNDYDIESNLPKASGLIIREPITNPANYRANLHFNDWLLRNNITGICGVDTRKITKLIKDKGAKSVALIYQENIDENLIKKIASELKTAGDLSGVELANKASLNQEYHWQKEGRWQQKNNSYQQINHKKLKVVAVDYGAKLNILRCLTELGCEVVIVGAKASYEEIIKHNPSGVFLSNGPGDPSATGEYAIPLIQKVLENKIPLFGICLGHQLLALAIGAKTKKMEQGHRGANHPVQNLKTKKVEITSQNHGFCVDENSIPDNAEVTHLSLFDQSVEGLRLKNGLAFSVQYHPESSPGPHDSFYLFEEFISLMKKKK